MDPINLEKLQAMKRDDSTRKSIFSTIIHYSLLVLLIGFFLSSTLWLPTLCSSMKLFVFLVFNLIIIFLVGESRLTGSSSELDIYEEYMSHSQRLRGLSSGEEKVKETVLEEPLAEEKVKECVLESALVEEKKDKVEEKEEEEVREVVADETIKSDEKEENDEKEEEEEEEEEKEKEEEMKSESEVFEEQEEKEERGLLPAEELNQRVEAFIAMFNMQMRLEARMVACCG